MHDIQVVNKPFKTLHQDFPSPKFRPSIEHQPNVICIIPCADCNWQARIQDFKMGGGVL